MTHHCKVLLIFVWALMYSIITMYMYSAAPRCFVCNERTVIYCEGCAQEFQTDGGLCSECDKRFHTHPKRAKHNRQNVTAGEPIGVSLDLLSVICIETSHYVCFTKQPSDDLTNPHKWIFFDSMANRVCKCTRNNHTPPPPPPPPTHTKPPQEFL